MLIMAEEAWWELPAAERLRPTSRSVVKSEGKPGKGSPKSDGSRMQALYYRDKVYPALCYIANVKITKPVISHI